MTTDDQTTSTEEASKSTELGTEKNSEPLSEPKPEPEKESSESKLPEEIHDHDPTYNKPSKSIGTWTSPPQISATALFSVVSVDSNGAQDKEQDGFTLKLAAIDGCEENKVFFRSLPVLHIGVVTPEVASKFEPGKTVTLKLILE